MMYDDETNKAAKRLMPPKAAKPEPKGDRAPPPPGGPPPAGDAAPPKPGAAKEKRAADLVADLPTPAEPLTPESVHLFSASLGKAVDVLSQGQVPAPPPLTPDGPTPQLPPELYIAGKVVSTAIGEGGPLASDARYTPFRFDMREAASSSDGLMDAAQKLGGLAKAGPPRPGGGKPPGAPTEESPPADTGAPEATAKRLMPQGT